MAQPNMMDASRFGSIGIFDSGVGGLTVLEAMIHLLPAEHYVYFGDSGNCPYGRRNKDEITQSSKGIVEFLLAKKCKLIIIACNTITTNIIDELRSTYPVPFIGMEPATKPASQQTRNKRIGILATKGTLNGELFDKTLKKYSDGITVYNQEGQGLVELIEKDEVDTPEMKNLLHRLLDPMTQAEIDTLVLGCTHYHYLKHVLQEILPKEVSIIDTSASVARQAGNILRDSNLLEINPQPRLEIFTSGEPANVRLLLKRLDLGSYQPTISKHII